MVGHSPEVSVAERGDSDGQSSDVGFGLLAKQRRRTALSCLTDHSRAIALADLAEDVAARENEEPITEIPKEEILRIRTSLYHNHVPRLVDAGAVEYDRDRNSVQISETADPTEFAHLLDAGVGGKR